jgi:hypothetical protein
MQITLVRYRELVSLRGCEHKALEATVGLGEPSRFALLSRSFPEIIWSKRYAPRVRMLSRTQLCSLSREPAQVLPAGSTRP